MDDKPGPTLQAKAAEDFDGSRPLIVFDGICVLCSGFARSVVSLDRGKKFRFVDMDINKEGTFPKEVKKIDLSTCTAAP